jgi:hypothetical protein
MKVPWYQPANYVIQDTIHIQYIIISIPILLFPIQANMEVISKRLRRVIESQLLIQSINLLHILILKLKVSFQIIPNTLRSLALRHHTPAMCNTPGKGNLCAALPILLANLYKNRFLLHCISNTFIIKVICFLTVSLPKFFPAS